MYESIGGYGEMSVGIDISYMILCTAIMYYVLKIHCTHCTVTKGVALCQA